MIFAVGAVKVPTMDARTLYHRLLQVMSLGQDVVLAAVISRSGSGPREAGASMLIETGGETLGTVGGGLLEAQAIDLAQAAMRQKQSFCRTFILTAKQAAEGGMICGGRMEVLVEYISGADTIKKEIIEKAASVQNAGRTCLLIRSLRTKDETCDNTARPLAYSDDINTAQTESSNALPVETGMGLLDGDDFRPGSLEVSRIDLDLKIRPQTETALIGDGEIRYFIQKTGFLETVIIAGAGHLSRELAPLCRLVDFRVVIIDDRAEFADRRHFPQADEVYAIESFENCFTGIAASANAYVVIVTRGHEHDLTVLSGALRTDAAYIGMIGSRSKRDAVFRELLHRGFSDADMARVYCPVGLTIGARTPAEIAVSIAAELIKVRSQKRTSS